MRKVFILILVLILLSGPQGCRVYRPLPPAKDSTVVRIKDSTVIRLDTVIVELPVEKETEKTEPTDTSRLETSLAKSEAFIDGRGKLNHSLENKDVDIPVQIEYRDKIITKDSIIVKSEPYPVEVKVPKRDSLFWVLAGWALLSLGGAALRMYFKR